MTSRPPPQDFRKQVIVSNANNNGTGSGGPITSTSRNGKHSRSGSGEYPLGSVNMETKESHHRNASQGKIMATNTPRKRDDIAVPASNPNGRKGSWSTASSDIGGSDSKESKEHRRMESESGNAAPARSRRPSIGGSVPRGATAKPAKERGPNFLATLDPERFICRPSKNAKKKKKAKAGEKTTSDQHVYLLFRRIIKLSTSSD
jgi:hypothetical protein